MKQGKTVKSDCIQLPNHQVIKSLEEGEIYIYLDVLEADEIMVNEIMDKVKKKYQRRVKKSRKQSEIVGLFAKLLTPGKYQL